MITLVVYVCLLRGYVVTFVVCVAVGCVLHPLHHGYTFTLDCVYVTVTPRLRTIAVYFALVCYTLHVYFTLRLRFCVWTPTLRYVTVTLLRCYVVVCAFAFTFVDLRLRLLRLLRCCVAFVCYTLLRCLRTVLRCFVTGTFTFVRLRYVFAVYLYVGRCYDCIAHAFYVVRVYVDLLRV